MKKKYRSKLEEQAADVLEEIGFKYEPETIPYWQPRKYTPDFMSDAYPFVCVEVKGFFRSGDTAKYLAIHEELAEDGVEFIFAFQDPDKPVRKGAKLTLAGWCEKNKIRWFRVDDLWELENYLNMGE